MDEIREIFKAYNRFDIIFDHGKGMYIYDTNGKEYLDFGSGIGVMPFGYGDEEFTKRLKEQLDKITHTSNLFYHKPLIDAAKKVCEITGLYSVFFTNSGAEANEGAIKCAKKYRYNKNLPTGEIISMNNSFHGRTMGALSVTGTEKYRVPFYPLVEKVNFAQFNDLDSVEALITEKTFAIILEPIQGEGGITPVSKEFLEGVRSICDKNDIVLILDEVQCGMYRSGYPFVWQKYGVSPDIMTMAKAISAGIPAGGFVVNENIAQNSLVPGDHGTTCGGNPLAMEAVSASIDLMKSKNIAEHVQKLTPYFENILDSLCGEFEFLKKRRGIGFMQGLVVDDSINIRDILLKSLDMGLIILSAGGNVIRFLPPLIADKEDFDKMNDILSKVFSTL